MPGAIKVQTPYRRCIDCTHDAAGDHCTLRCADDLALRMEWRAPTACRVFMQNTGGPSATGWLLESGP